MYCRKCGKKVDEYCHNYLCLSCCAERVRLESEMYNDSLYEHEEKLKNE